MYAVAFDLVVRDTVAHHPKHDPAAAYRDIRAFKVEQWSDFTAIIKAKP